MAGCCEDSGVDGDVAGGFGTELLVIRWWEGTVGGVEFEEAGEAAAAEFGKLAEFFFVGELAAGFRVRGSGFRVREGGFRFSVFSFRRRSTGY